MSSIACIIQAWRTKYPLFTVTWEETLPSRLWMCLHLHKWPAFLQHHSLMTKAYWVLDQEGVQWGSSPICNCWISGQQFCRGCESNRDIEKTWVCWKAGVWGNAVLLQWHPACCCKVISCWYQRTHKSCRKHANDQCTWHTPQRISTAKCDWGKLCCNPERSNAIWRELSRHPTKNMEYSAMMETSWSWKWWHMYMWTFYDSVTCSVDKATTCIGMCRLPQTETDTHNVSDWLVTRP